MHINKILADFNAELQANPTDTISKYCEQYHLSFKTDGSVGILYHKKNIPNIKHLNTQILSGVIISTNNTPKLLSIPTPIFTRNVNSKWLTKHIDNYDIYKANDGTIITLYYNNKWIISTSTNQDANDMKWIGPLTYMQVFNDICCAIGFDINCLDKNYSYCFVMKHPQFHPFDEYRKATTFSEDNNFNTYGQRYSRIFEFTNDINECLNSNDKRNLKLTFVHKFDMRTLQKSTTCNLMLSNGELMQEQQKVSAHYQDLQELCNDSLERYIRYGECNFGFLFMAKDDFDGSSSSRYIYVESSLQASIRKLVYRMPKNIQLDHTNRIQYIAIRAYISYNIRYSFIALFPQFIKIFRDFRTIISRLVDRMIQAERNRNIQFDIIKSKNLAPPGSVNIDRLAKVFLNIIHASEKINIYDKHSKNIIYDYVVDPIHTNIYFDIIFNQNKK